MVVSSFWAPRLTFPRKPSNRRREWSRCFFPLHQPCRSLLKIPARRQAAWLGIEMLILFYLPHRWDVGLLRVLVSANPKYSLGQAQFNILGTKGGSKAQSSVRWKWCALQGSQAYPINRVGIVITVSLSGISKGIGVLGTGTRSFEWTLRRCILLTVVLQTFNTKTA